MADHFSWLTLVVVLFVWLSYTTWPPRVDCIVGGPPYRYYGWPLEAIDWLPHAQSLRFWAVLSVMNKLFEVFFLSATAFVTERIRRHIAKNGLKVSLRSCVCVLTVLGVLLAWMNVRRVTLELTSYVGARAEVWIDAPPSIEAGVIVVWWTPVPYGLCATVYSAGYVIVSPLRPMLASK